MFAEALYNAEAFHVAATSLMYMDQAYIRHTSDRNNFNLRVVNWPLPRQVDNKVEALAIR